MILLKWVGSGDMDWHRNSVDIPCGQRHLTGSLKVKKSAKLRKPHLKGHFPQSPLNDYLRLSPPFSLDFDSRRSRWTEVPTFHADTWIIDKIPEGNVDTVEIGISGIYWYEWIHSFKWKLVFVFSGICWYDSFIHCTWIDSHLITCTRLRFFSWSLLHEIAFLLHLPIFQWRLHDAHDSGAREGNISLNGKKVIGRMNWF